MQCDSNVLLPLVNSVVCRVILAHRMSKSGKGAAGRVAASIKTFYVLTSRECRSGMEFETMEGQEAEWDIST